MKDLALIAFGVGLAWLLYEFLIYPVLLALVARVRRIRPVTRTDYCPTVSVLISARNEERDILWKVQETLAWDYPAERLEVLVASDASTDRTDEILGSVGDPRLRWVRMEKRGGKGRALNKLAEMAKGELLFFSDANSHIDGGCLQRVVRHFADPKVGCVTGNSNSSEACSQQGASSGTPVYWGHELLIRHFENQFGSVLVCDGALFSIRRKLYTPVLPDLANDLELPLRIGGADFWILHEPSAQVVEKDTSSPSEEFSRRRRICAQGALGFWKLRGVLRGIRLWQFVSHKVMRWLILVPLALLFASSLLLSAIPVFAALAMAQALFYLLALAGWILLRRGRDASRIFTIPVYICVSSIGAFAGVVDALRGRRFDVWESPALSRGDQSVNLGRAEA